MVGYNVCYMVAHKTWYVLSAIYRDDQKVHILAQKLHILDFVDNFLAEH